jgi:hypothetical protein
MRGLGEGQTLAKERKQRSLLLGVNLEGKEERINNIAREPAVL